MNNSTGMNEGSDAIKSTFTPMKQQRLVRDFLQNASPYRGLLLYHGLGSGKTCAAILASDVLRLQGDRRIVVLLPASIRDNYVRELRKCGATTSARSSVVEFVNYNGLSAKKVQEMYGNGIVRSGSDDDGYSGPNRARARNRKRNPFDRAVVIIDEVHNFVSNVSNKRLLGVVYRRLMAAKECKILLLSGTPLVNEPHELAYLVNLVHGYIRIYDFALRVPLDERTEAMLRRCPDVVEFGEGGVTEEAGRHQTRSRAHRLSVRLTPPGFTRRTQDSMDLVAADPDMHPLQRVTDILRSGPGLLHSSSPSSSHSSPARSRERRERYSVYRDVELLPSDADTFRELFVDETANALRNEQQLANRLVGCVSYFPGHDESLYPRMRRMLFVPARMSPRQFSEYSLQRRVEIRQELAALRRLRMARGNLDSGARYRSLSRASCNFAFPEEVPRPRRKIGVEDAEAAVDRSYESALDEATESIRRIPGRLSLKNGALDELSPKFAAIVRSLLAPDNRRARERTLETLRNSMPAHDIDMPITERLSESQSSPQHPPPPTPGSSKLNVARGTAIVYSQFRRAEGIQLLAYALEANGFDRLVVEKKNNDYVVTVRPGVQVEGGGAHVEGGEAHVEGGAQVQGRRPRYVIYSNDDPTAASILLAIFNNQLDELPASVTRSLGVATATASAIDVPYTNLHGELVRVMLITQSGAEGISTRNVRQVHIMEPFWHANRIEQVIGRARRAYSHDDLPPSDRTLDVFIYVAKMTAKQAATHPRDNGITSDEFVLDVSRRKRQLLEKMLTLMKRTAIDCGLYAPSLQPGAAACYRPTPPDGDELALTYHFDISKDVGRRSRASPRRKLTAVRAHDGKLYYADLASGILYDYDTMKRHNKAVAVGKM